MGYGIEITTLHFFLVYMPTPRSQTPPINDRDGVHMKKLVASWIPCMHESKIRSTLYLSL
jgi:hypothetical protein